VRHGRRRTTLLALLASLALVIALAAVTTVTNPKIYAYDVIGVPSDLTVTPADGGPTGSHRLHGPLTDAPRDSYDYRSNLARTNARLDGDRLAPRGIDAGTDLVLASDRTRLLHRAGDSRLRDVVEQLYRPNARIGSGSAMDAYRFEQRTGQLLSRTGHGTKLLERRTQLQRMLPGVSGADRTVARDLLIDIQNALSGL
jgi:hypothetical protein